MAFRTPKPLDVEGRRIASKPARRDETIAIAHPRVARRAKHVVLVPAAHQDFMSNREWHEVARIAANLTRIKVCVGA